MGWIISSRHFPGGVRVWLTLSGQVRPLSARKRVRYAELPVSPHAKRSKPNSDGDQVGDEIDPPLQSALTHDPDFYDFTVASATMASAATHDPDLDDDSLVQPTTAQAPELDDVAVMEVAPALRELGLVDQSTSPSRGSYSEKGWAEVG